MRIYIDLKNRPVSYRFLDSVHAALITGMVEAGIEACELIGEAAQNWCFAAKGYSLRGGDCLLKGVTVSAASEQIADRICVLDPRAVRVASSNGDRFDLSHGVLRKIPERLTAETREAMFMFASPFVLPEKKRGSGKTRYLNSLDGVDVDAALRRSLERRAGRPLDIVFGIDRLSLRADGMPRIVRYRRMRNGRDQMIDAFSLPVAVKGTPDAIRFAYLAGLGAKTRVGFGCPVVPH